MRSAKNRLAITTVSLILFWPTLSGSAHAEPQPFLVDDFDGVYTDSLVVRYRIAKQEIYKTGQISWCPANSALPNQGCTTAVHRFCRYERGHATGFGFSAPGPSNMMDISCLTAKAIRLETRTRADLTDNPTSNEQRLLQWCLGDNPFGIHSPNHHCSVGISRACGLAGGFGPVDRIVGESITYACFEDGVTAPFQEQPGSGAELAACLVGHGSEIVGDACHRAMAGFCAAQGLHGGYGPGEGNDEQISFGCARAKQPWVANTLLPMEPSLPVDVLQAETVLDSNGRPSFSDPPLHNLLWPSLAQTYDGRLSVGAKGADLSTNLGGAVNFRMQMPETFDAPLGQTQSAGRERSFLKENEGGVANGTSITDMSLLRGSATNPADHLVLVSSIAVCDPALSGPIPHITETQSLRSRESNPRVCDALGNIGSGNHDCYDITVVARFHDPGPANDELWATPVRVIVAYPKGIRASGIGNWPKLHIDVNQIGTPKKVPIEGHDILEPVISGNGRLLVAQVDGFIQYSVLGANFDACDAAGWTEFKHISQMYDDDRMANYGLAQFPLRDVENNLVSTLAGTSVKAVHGAYPWVDRDGDMLIFIAGDQSLYYVDDANEVQSRYPILGHPLLPTVVEPTLDTVVDDAFNGGRRIGLTAVGLWSQGKFFTPDTRNNNLDINIPSNRADLHRLLRLYQDVPLGTEVGASEKVVLASPENQFIFLPNLQPEAPHEVVWHLASQGDTDEIVFDDVNHPRALIVSEMSASLNLVRDFFAVDSLHSRYNDGFEWNATPRDVNGNGTIDFGHSKLQGRGFVKPAHVANNASAISQEVADFAAAAHAPNQNPLASAVQWQVPASGLLLGGARIEPLAAGGFRAKGLWLDGEDDRVEYLIPLQTNASDFATSAWFMNLSVDPRDMSGTQQLLTWPDSSSLALVNGPNGQQLRLAWPGGSAPPITLDHPDLQLINGSWTTVAVLSEPGASNVTRDLTLFIDGLMVAKFEDLNEGFRLQPGLMIIGAENGGIRGWIDDFKVIVARPSLEEVCNHAGGTLVGIHDQSDEDLRALAAAYPPSAHTLVNDEIRALGLSPSHTQYVCEQANSSSGERVCLGKTHRPMPADCIRPVLHLLETALEWDQSRPDSTTNSFCLSCHVESNPSATMQPSQALVENNALDMHFDPRRQPLQPFPLLNGVIPPDYFGPGDPGTSPPGQSEPNHNNLDARTHPSLSP